MQGDGRIYQRGAIDFIAYSIGGREYRESTRSRVWADAQRLLEQRLQEREAAARQAGDAPRVTFDTLAAGYLEEYAIRELRTLNTARGQIANLTRVFGGMQAALIAATQIRRYQAARRQQGAAAGTVNRETAALHRLLRLGVRAGQLPRVPPFPERLRESPPRQGSLISARPSRPRTLAGTLPRRARFRLLLRLAQARDSRPHVGGGGSG
jgi:hypothetical protein